MKSERRRFGVVLGVALMLAFPIARTEAAEKEVSWRFDLSARRSFFDWPFPTELRRAPDGSINVDDFPNPLEIEMVDRTKEAVKRGYGYSTAPVIYFRFTGPVNTENFPTPEESFAPDSPLFLIDIDPSSPEKGRRFPLLAQFYPRGPSYMKFFPHLLALMPVPGFVLKENTLYAAGVLRSLSDPTGRPLAKNPHLERLRLGYMPQELFGPAAHAVYAPGMKELAAHGVNLEELAALTIFRTGDPSRRMLMLFEGIKNMTKFEFETPLHMTRSYDLYTVLEGAVLLPQFQDGTPPYSRGLGGRIHFDEAGRPIIQRWERVPVAFSIPKGKMPPSGFPITIYIHGTGGTSTQFIDRGEVTEESPPDPHASLLTRMVVGHGMAAEGTGPALIFARHGIAGVGAAQQHAAERGGLPEQLYFYNFLSPEAFRDNILQAAAEATMLLRLVKGLEIDPTLCPGTDTGAGPVRFDPDLIFGMGQSLGSLILGPWGAVETDLKALIPSGNGAYWNLFVAEGNAGDFDFLQKRRLEQGRILRLDRFHPLLSLLHIVAAEADPFAYQERYFLRPFPGRPAKHVWASFGILDNYFYPVSQNAALLAMGLDFAGPILEPSTAEMLRLAGLKILSPPVALNKQTPAGAVTAVAVHFEEHGPLNGHHVNFQRDDAKYQYGCFLETLVREGRPTVYPPREPWNAPCAP